MEVRLTLGSNTNQQHNIAEAQRMLKRFCPSIIFSEPCWTTPIGIVSDDFLNVEATGHTSLSLEQFCTGLKEIERLLGDNHANHNKGIVLIDIDLIDYGNTHLKDIIWKKD